MACRGLIDLQAWLWLRLECRVGAHLLVTLCFYVTSVGPRAIW